MGLGTRGRDRGVGCRCRSKDGGTLLVRLLPVVLVTNKFILLCFLMFEEVFTRVNNTSGAALAFNGSHTQHSSNGHGAAFTSITNTSRRGRRVTRVISFLGGPLHFNRVNTGVPHNILLVNPPNANGALLTHTITNRTNIPFFSVSNSSFIRVFININTSHIHSLFDRTGGTTPTVIFVSRVSTIKHRENANLNNNRSRERRALGRLLIRVSNFNSGRNIVIVTTAGHPSILSGTLLHPKHFSERVAIGCPSAGNHRRVLGIRSHKGPLNPSMDLGAVTGSASNFANTSLTGLLGRTTLLTIHHNGGTVARSRVRRTAVGIMVNTRGGSRVMDSGSGVIATCRRTNRTIISCFLPARSPIRRVSVVHHNVTTNCAVCLPARRGKRISHNRLLRRVYSLLNKHTTRRLARGSVYANTSGSVRHTASLTHRVIAHFNVDRGLNLITCNGSGGRIFLNHSFSSAPGCSRGATTLVSSRVRSVIVTRCGGTLRVLGGTVPGLRRATGVLFRGRGVSNDRFVGLVRGVSLRVGRWRWGVDPCKTCFFDF